MVPDDKSTAPVQFRLGDILKKYRLITEEQLNTALEEQKTSKTRLGKILIQKGWITEDDMNFVLSQQLDIPYVHLTMEMVDMNLINEYPANLLVEYEILPLIVTGTQLSLVMSDPTDLEAIARVSETHHQTIQPVLAKNSAIQQILDKLFRSQPGSMDSTDLLKNDTKTIGTFRDNLKQQAGQAFEENIREFHYIPGGTEVSLKVRIGEQLTQREQIPAEKYLSLLRNYKSVFGIDSSHSKAPRAAGIFLDFTSMQLCLEARFIPSPFGVEGLVLKLKPLELQKQSLLGSGFTQSQLTQLHTAWDDASQGILWVTGLQENLLKQTGYALLAAMGHPHQKITIIENTPGIYAPQYSQWYTDYLSPHSMESLIYQASESGSDIVLADWEKPLPSTVDELWSMQAPAKMIILTREPNLNRLFEKIYPFKQILHKTIGAVSLHQLPLLCQQCKIKLSSLPAGLEAAYQKGNGCMDCQQTGYSDDYFLTELFLANEHPYPWHTGRISSDPGQVVLPGDWVSMDKTLLPMIHQGVISLKDAEGILD